MFSDNSFSVCVSCSWCSKKRVFLDFFSLMQLRRHKNFCENVWHFPAFRYVEFQKYIILSPNHASMSYRWTSYPWEMIFSYASARTNVDNEGSTTTKSSATNHLQLTNGLPASETFSAGHRVQYACPPSSDPCVKRWEELESLWNFFSLAGCGGWLQAIGGGQIIW